MERTPPGPELSSDAPAPGCPHCACCPHCGARTGGLADPRVEDMAVLGELRDVGMVLVRALVRQVEATGHAGEAEKAMLEGMSRSVRRTVAMRLKIYEDSLKTAEQRHAENLRRIDAQVRAQFRVRKAAIVRAVEGEIRAHVERDGGDAERLLCDMHERLLDADIERASTKQEIDAIILDICKGLGIVPRDETWSDVAVAEGIRDTKAELDRIEAARVPPEGVSVTAPEPPPKEPRVYPKIGRFSFGPDGAICSVDPPEFDPPESEWAPDILNRPPIDLLKARKPPDTG